MKITLRDATLADAKILREWDEKPHLLEAGDDDWQWETELPKNPPWRQMLIAELDDKPIGFLQIIDPALEETHYWGDIEPNLRALDIWIGEEDYLGQGYGTQMMTQALERCFEDFQVKAALVDPLVTNTRAHKFYEKMRFKKVDHRWFDEDECFVYRLERKDWEEKYGQ